MNEETIRARPGRPSLGFNGPKLQHVEMVPTFEQSRLDLEEIASLARRNGLGLTLWTLLCVGLASLYLFQADAQYLGKTQVVLEPRRQVTSLSPADAAAELTSSLDSSQADSQIEVVRSERNLRFVFETLKIADDPLYAPKPPSLLQRQLNRLFPSSSDDSLAPDERAKRANAAAFEAFRSLVDVTRLGQSYVLEVSFLGPTPAEAVKLANAITAAFVLDQIRYKAASVERGTEYLQGRITNLQAEQDAATTAVRTGIIPDVEFADSEARVVSAAVEPLYKAYPKSKLTLLFALLGGLLSGVGAIAIRHAFDRKVRSRTQFQRALGYECLALVPRLSLKRGMRPDYGVVPYLAVLEMPDSKFASSIRILRTAISSLTPASGHISVGIVSCGPGEGRSTIAANLAFLLAASGSASLLVDADLRNPMLSRTLANGASAGLHDVIEGRSPSHILPEVIVARGLAFTPAAGVDRTIDPNAFLGSDAMRSALKHVRRDRSVVVDLPPLNVSADAQALGQLLDGLILCVEVNKTTLDDVAEAVRALEGADVRVLGVLLNRTPLHGERRRNAGPH